MNQCKERDNSPITTKEANMLAALFKNLMLLDDRRQCKVTNEGVRVKVLASPKQSKVPREPKPKYDKEALGRQIKEVEASVPTELSYYIEEAMEHMMQEAIPGYLSWEVYSLALKAIAVKLDSKYSDNIRNCKDLWVIDPITWKPIQVFRANSSRKDWNLNINFVPVFRCQADLIVAQKIIKSLREGVKARRQ
jgi:hypothetical protein